MTHQALIDQYLAAGGAVTVCPPRTFSEDAGAPPLSWLDQQERRRRIAARNRKFETHRRQCEVPAVAPAKPAPKARKAAKPVLAIKPRAERKAVTELKAPPIRRRAFSDDQIRDAVKGRTCAEAAAHLGVSHRAMRNYISILGIKTKRQQRDTGATPIGPIIAAIKSGLTIRDAAEKLGVCTATISSRLRAAGLSVVALTGEGKTRGANKPHPCIIGEYRWPSYEAAAVDLGINVNTLKSRLGPNAKERSRAKLAAAVIAWATRDNATGGEA